MAASDRLSDIYTAVPAVEKLTSPWQKGGHYRYDRALLRKVIQVPVKSGAALVSATGGLANAVDVWIATELRRAGMEPDAVWPRTTPPRSLPQSVSRAAAAFRYSRTAATRELQESVVRGVVELAGSSRTDILGGYFQKEIDVTVAEYDRGLELGVSTKTMSGSAAKNVGNRFEEAAGDLANIRRRYPLATFGYAYLVTRNVLVDEPAAWDRIKDMLRKLRSLSTSDESASYDATCLVVVDWKSGKVVLDEKSPPEDLSPDCFFETLMRRLFSRSPVSEHVEARRRWQASGPSDEFGL